eukprot:Sspe_Gene.99365::Locus_72894_Transcript_1_2_Confidence_0.750_Length_303::g.99365::m.99365
MVAELKRAESIATELLKAKAVPTESDISRIWEHSDFFCKYPNYLEVSVKATNEDAGRRWAGFAESRLRRLLSQLEKVPYGARHRVGWEPLRNLTVHLWPK